MKALYRVFSTDEKLIKKAMEFVRRYGNDSIERSEPVSITLKFIYQMQALSSKEKTHAYVEYRRINSKDLEPESYDANDKALMLRILNVDKAYKLVTSHKGEELYELTFEVNDVRAIEQIENMIKQANHQAYVEGRHHIAFGDYDVPSIRNSIYCTPLAKLKRASYNDWDD
jgi:hypothetical protein